ncbi:MAG TPA: DinB family protein [Bryobacteraceae bacterium]|nr:DinB family protein [Bryobacteraceae bacterium]
MTKPQMLGQLDSMKEFFDRSTRLLEEADSNMAPKEGMFTAAQQVAHAAQTVEWFFRGVFSPEGFDMNFEAMDNAVRSTTSLSAARTWMDRACAEAKAAVASHSEQEWAARLPPGPILGGLPKTAIFSALTDHTAHHRGALTVYTRLLGKVPPMPYMEM